MGSINYASWDQRDRDSPRLLQEGIVDALDDGSRFNVRITYIDQPDPKGIAHAVLISKDFLRDDPFVVYLGDNLLRENIPHLAKEFLESRADALVVLTKVRDPGRFGVVKINHGKIVRLVEKPKYFVSDYALAGVYFLRPSIFPVIDGLKPSWRNELEITEAFNRSSSEEAISGSMRHRDGGKTRVARKTFWKLTSWSSETRPIRQRKTGRRCLGRGPC